MWFGCAARARRSTGLAAAGATFAPIACLAAFGAAWAASPVGPGPTDGRGCSEPFRGLRSPETTYFVARPLADTLPDPTSDAPAFGQLAETSRVGGARADLLRRELETDSRVVLVPWGFDDRCRTIAWSGPWRWATTDAAGFYRGRLRPANRWIDGRPTFDVEQAVWEGFPVSPWDHPLRAGRPGLAATELFELYERLPTPDALATRPYGAVSELVEWRRDAGDALQRYPARTLLEAAFRTADLVRLRTTRLPFAGTYRVRVEGPEGDSLAAFVLRTGAVGSEPLDSGSATTDEVPTAPVPANAFGVSAALAPTLDGLADSAPTSEAASASADGDGCFRTLALRAGADDTAPEGASRAWPAELALSLVTGCFRDAPTLAELQPLEGPDAAASDGTTDADVPEDDTRPSADGSAPSTGFAGAFQHESDGRFTFHQPAALPDGRTVRLVGTRVELTSLPDPPALPSRLR
ncbi:MAG: hypothetical protein ACODAA_03745 [Gemmatimonadota bacterium]